MLAVVVVVTGLSGPFSRVLANDLCPLSDEFGDPATLADWSRIHEEEEWFADQVEVLDVDTTTPGALTLIPYTVSWYQDWRGPLLYKLVDGDFAVTTSVTVTARDGVSIPASTFSLGGLLIREPRDVTPATWVPDGENYVFLSIGYGNAVPQTFQFEVKTTENSVSTLFLTPAPGPAAEIQTVRIGEYVITLRHEPGDTWRVHRRYHRPDFGSMLQVGMVTYTDWEKCATFVPFDHNSVTITPPLPGDPSPGTPFTPDAMARFDYVRFQRIELPAHLAGLDLSDPGAVSDAELLAFLGAAANPDPSEECETVAAPPVDDDAVGDAASVTDVVAEVRATPNPFAGATTVSFHLRQRAWVDISVFDVTGRRVATPSSALMDSGSQQVTWRPSESPDWDGGSGTYWVRVRAFDTSVRTEKLGESVVRITHLD